MTFFPLFGVLFVPFFAKAVLFSSFLGNNAYAKTDTSTNTVIFPQADVNSQNMALLQANVSSASIFEEKDKASANSIDTNVSVNIVSDNALLPTSSPLDVSVGVYDGIGNGDFSFDQVSVYVVKSEDNLSIVADMFGVTVDTILSANNMKKSDKLKEGDVLLILPFSGVEHTITKGQTLQSIANLYKVDADKILVANDMNVNTKLSIGEKLMIPGASMLSEIKPKIGSGSVAKTGGSATMPSVVGYFKNPVPNGRKTQGVSRRHQGVDIGAPTGTPIYAAADGKVLASKLGWNGAYGNMVILQHPNGTKTLYAHMSRLNTTTDTQVSQGQVIGYVGSTGRSTGPHLHFEVLGAKNPF